MKLIPKDALVAEIERRKQDAINNCGGFKSVREHECDSCIVGQYEEMKNIIDTLEVKETDLEKHEREINIIIDILDREEHNGHLSHQDLKDCVLFLKLLQKSL